MVGHPNAYHTSQQIRSFGLINQVNLQWRLLISNHYTVITVTHLGRKKYVGKCYLHNLYKRLKYVSFNIIHAGFLLLCVSVDYIKSFKN